MFCRPSEMRTTVAGGCLPLPAPTVLTATVTAACTASPMVSPTTPPAARGAARARRKPRPRAAPARAGSAGTGLRSSSGRPVTPPEEPRERPEPVAPGRERDVRHADRGEHRHELLAFLGRGGGKALAHDGVARVHAQLLAGLGVDE